MEAKRYKQSLVGKPIIEFAIIILLTGLLFSIANFLISSTIKRSVMRVIFFCRVLAAAMAVFALREMARIAKGIEKNLLIRRKNFASSYAAGRNKKTVFTATDLEGK